MLHGSRPFLYLPIETEKRETKMLTLTILFVVVVLELAMFITGRKLGYI